MEIEQSRLFDWKPLKDTDSEPEDSSLFLTINRNRVSFTGALFQKLGEPDFLEVLYAPKAKAFGMRKAERPGKSVMVIKAQPGGSPYALKTRTKESFVEQVMNNHPFDKDTELVRMYAAKEETGGRVVFYLKDSETRPRNTSEWREL